MAEDSSAVEIRGVSKSYGRKRFSALDDVSLTIGKGEIVSIIGKNGAGKTTLVKLVTGLVYPTSGTIGIFDTTTDDAKDRVGVLFEDNYLYPHLSGLDNLFLACNEIRILKNDMFSILDKFGLSERLLSIRASGFSHGQGRRLLLAATILRNPDLFLLDEPFNGLDSQGVDGLTETMITEREKGKSFLVTGQNLSYLADIVDRVVYIDAGRIAYDGDVSGARHIAPGDVVAEATDPSRFASFLLSKNVKFLSKGSKVFFHAKLEEAREIEEEATKQSIEFARFDFKSMEDGGQNSENLNQT